MSNQERLNKYIEHLSRDKKASSFLDGAEDDDKLLTAMRVARELRAHEESGKADPMFKNALEEELIILAKEERRGVWMTRLGRLSVAATTFVLVFGAGMITWNAINVSEEPSVADNSQPRVVQERIIVTSPQIVEFTELASEADRTMQQSQQATESIEDQATRDEFEDLVQQVEFASF